MSFEVLLKNDHTLASAAMHHLKLFLIITVIRYFLRIIFQLDDGAKKTKCLGLC